MWGCGPFATALVAFAQLLSLCSGDREERTNKLIYEKIEGSFPCFRRLNGTHQIGCASPLAGEVGVIYLIEDDDDLKWVTNQGPHEPYVAAMYPDKMSWSIMNKLKVSGRVAGVLVLNVTARTKELKKFSMDLSCPNRGFGFYLNSTSQHYCEKWNEAGEGVLFDSYNFPMFYVQSEKSSLAIVDCFNKFNRPVNGSSRDWPLCSAQLKAFMLAAVDTPTCLRRSERFNLEPQNRVCDPMGDLNIWSSLIPSNQSEPYSNPDGSVIVISAKLDSASLFEGLAHGADSAGTGVATLLAVLKELSKHKEEMLKSKSIKNVYFILFHGESFDYIGSSRMVYDMKNDGFPSGIKKDDRNVTALFNITDIKYYIEIGQVGLIDNNTPFYIHGLEHSSDLKKVLVEQGSKAKVNFEIASITEQMGLPPGSFQSFLKEKPSIPGVIITNFEKEFRNKFYNSLFDDDVRLEYDYEKKNSVATIKIAGLSTAITNTVLSLIGSSNFSETPDFETANELLHCYVKTGNCTLFQNVTGNKIVSDAPLDLYVGVNRHFITATHLTRMLMIYFQGTPLSSIEKEDNCKNPDDKKNVNYEWMNGICYETSVNVSQAESPAFVIDNYDWKSGQYSTWTESVWQQFSVRIFLKPSKAHEIITLVSGIVVFLVSFVIIGWISSKSDIIFPTRPAGMAC